MLLPLKIKCERRIYHTVRDFTRTFPENVTDVFVVVYLLPRELVVVQDDILAEAVHQFSGTLDFRPSVLGPYNFHDVATIYTSAIPSS